MPRCATVRERYAGRLMQSFLSLYVECRHMSRPRPSPSSDASLLPSLHARNMRYCGFECPRCGYHLLLSDIVAGTPIIDLFRDGSEAHAIPCPECDNLASFGRKDLKLFGLRRDD
jgi:hypothetical protein